MGLSVWHVILILAAVLIVFGAGKLPRVMGDVAKGIKNFKAGMTEDGGKADTAEASGVTHHSTVAVPEAANTAAARPADKTAAGAKS